MTYRLSLLEKSLIPQGSTAAEALHRTTQLAQRAEALGYYRFWLNEHHGNHQLAGVAPEILIAYLLARTSSIRVGSGGVMLQHYSPFKVAETFKLLASLAPGRVDLGVGKAPGGLPATTRALQSRHDKQRPTAFDDLLAELGHFLDDSLPEEHPLAGAIAHPVPPLPPARILLGASTGSAETAARLGWDFCYAGHFNGDPVNVSRSLRVFREASGRSPLLALFAFVAETQEEAQRLAGAKQMVKLHLSTGQSVNLPTQEAAAEFAHAVGDTAYRTELLTPHVIAGTAEQVRAELDALHERHGVDEFLVEMPVPDYAARLTSIELLAGALVPAAAN
ncbi:MAG: LLM class flavin-dependent oxidoreductase [Paucibacter sp.]|nr:LLM class flavin-dependent oxidoreductase [Roseateles sp.]